MFPEPAPLQLGILRRAEVPDENRKKKPGYEVTRRPEPGELSFFTGDEDDT